MIELDISKLFVTEKIEITCDNCFNNYERTIKNRKVSLKKFNKDLCKTCAYKESAKNKPQCNSLYWTDEKKLEHSLNIKNSEDYKKGIENRPNIEGENNPMFGKNHSIDTKLKMSKSRTGKIGENSTAWKGGKNSLVQRIKTYQYRNNWYSNIYKRDNYKCTICNTKKNIEIHHIKPMSIIVNEVKKELNSKDDNILYEYLINMHINISLDNGIVVCRKCHRDIHINWGGHLPKLNNKI